MSEYLVSRLRVIETKRGDRGDINGLLTELTPNATPLTLTELRETIRDNHLFVARNEAGRIIGMATLVIYRKPTGKIGLVEDVVVTEAFRGREVGKQIMAMLIKVAVEQGLKRLDLTSNKTRTAAHGLYRSLGFEVRETTVFKLPL